jgi:T4 RnlA family RNA ligase
MNTIYPRIEHIDVVKSAIADSPEFIVAPRPWGVVVNYLVNSPTTFPPFLPVPDDNPETQATVQNANLLAAIRRECRGITFCPKTGVVTRRMLNKFWNISEKPETQLDALDFTQPHRVYTKMDGSVIAPFETWAGSGHVRWGSKMGADTEVALAAEQFVADNPHYQQFAEWCIANSVTPIFEYTSPGPYKIVLEYDRPMLTLLAARHMFSGEYINFHRDTGVWFVEKMQELGIPLVTSHDPVADPTQFLEKIRELSGEEGVVIAWDSGYRVKAKSNWYVLRHNARDKIMRENNVIRMIIEEQMDDVKSLLDPPQREAVETFERDFWEGVEGTAREWQKINHAVRLKFGDDRKRFALDSETKNMIGYCRSAIFGAWDTADYDWIGAVTGAISKNLGSQPKVDSARFLWNNHLWKPFVVVSSED